MAFGFPPQSDVLFDSKWDVDKDSCFIDIVVRDMETNPTEKQSNILIASLRRAHKGLNERYCSKFTWDDVCSRYAKLKDRYRTFRSLIAQPRVYWDELANVVHADPTVWARVCERNGVKQCEIEKAYYYCGEGAFQELRGLFENKVKKELSWEKTTEEDEHNMINEETSSTSMQHARRRLFGDSISDGNMFTRRVPRRPDIKLFCSRRDKGSSSAGSIP